MRHHLFQFWIILILITLCGLFSLIPFYKYQSVYIEFIHKFNNIPQEHLNGQIEYANSSGNVDIEIYTGHKKYEDKLIEKERKPFFIRDKKNSKILHPYRD